ncbi:hypothetical protein SPFM20_00046 [Salmonella phage SPFM20]|nr:hypothetical protein SPFM20_00046 [Salmonella phage SPFM20]
MVDITPSTDGLNHFNIYSILPPEEKEAFVRYLLRMGYPAAFGFTLPASAETTYPVLRQFLRSALERLRVDGASVDALGTLVQSYFAL